VKTFIDFENVFEEIDVFERQTNATEQLKSFIIEK
jgi:hypothetical protein